MIEVTEIVGLFLEALPTAKPEWEEHLQYWEGERAGEYNHIAVFAHHMVDYYERGQTDSFPRVFQLVERLILEGDNETQGIAIVGFLEDLQNIASHTSFGSAVFVPYLLPKSLTAWQELEAFWQGKSNLMEVIEAESRGPAG